MKKLISLLFIAMLTFVGCSSVTPAPEVIITNTDPPGGITTKIDVFFENKNYVDAIITNQTIAYRDTMVSTVDETYSYNISLYINANTVTKLTTTFASLPFLGGPTSGRTMQLTFTGTDAYGYNKTFTASTVPICY